MPMHAFLVSTANLRMSNARFHCSTQPTRVGQLLAAAIAPDALGVLAVLVGRIK